MSTIVENLNWRYACKKFDPEKKLTDDQVNTLLDVLRLTPSSYGLQPWKFVIVENKDLREKLVGASWNQKQVAEASHLIVLCSPKKIDEAFIDSYLKDQANTRGQDIESLAGFKKMLMSIANKSPEDQYKWAKNQVYIALGSLMTACAELRIDSCPMEGFSPEDVDQILGLEANEHSCVLLTVGYRAADDQPKPKVRFPLDTLIVKN